MRAPWPGGPRAAAALLEGFALLVQALSATLSGMQPTALRSSPSGLLKFVNPRVYGGAKLGW